MSDTPETEAAVTTFTSISKLKKRFECSTGKVSAEFARKLERERDGVRSECKALWVMVDVEKKKTYTALRERDEARDTGERLSKQGLDMMDQNRSLKSERDEMREVLRQIAEASGFDNIGNWARNKALEALKTK